jgi:hypothetical protein
MPLTFAVGLRKAGKTGIDAALDEASLEGVIGRGSGRSIVSEREQ